MNNNLCKKDTIYKAAVDKATVDKDSVDKDSVDKDSVDKDSVDKDSVDKDIIDNGLIYKDNKIRKISFYLLDIINKKTPIKNFFIGIYYCIIHCFIYTFVTLNLLFNTNINHLIVLLIIVTLDAASIIFLHGCPLTLLEQKYLGKNSVNEWKNIVKKIGIVYNCEHTYEYQLDLLITVWSLIAIKCLLIMTLGIFNYKLNNYNSIYQN